MSSTSQLNSIRRVTMPVPTLLKTEVLIEKLDSGLPTLHDALLSILSPQMLPSIWSKFVMNIPIKKSRSGNTVVWCMSKKGVNIFNSMSCNIQTKEEKTMGIECIYTDDEDFDIRKCPRVSKEEVFKKYESGERKVINDENVYVLMTKTKTIKGNLSDTITDYIVYIPPKMLGANSDE